MADRPIEMIGVEAVVAHDDATVQMMEAVDADDAVMVAVGRKNFVASVDEIHAIETLGKRVRNQRMIP